MTWIPEDQRDTRWYIWHQTFMVRVSFLDSVSVEYIQHFGVPISGDADHDRSTTRELVIRMMTIAEMLEFHRRGVTVAVVSPGDTKRIYEYVTNHLNAWKHELEHAFHIRNAPLQDLKDLDAFAHTVYAHAKYQFTDTIVESVLAKRLGSAGLVPRAKLLPPPPGVGVSIHRPLDAPEPSDAPLDRQRMAEIFAAREAAGRPKWN